MRRDEQILRQHQTKTFVKDPAFTTSLAYPAISKRSHAGHGRSLAADVDDMPSRLHSDFTAIIISATIS